MGSSLFPTRWMNYKPPSIKEFVDTFRDDSISYPALFLRKNRNF